MHKLELMILLSLFWGCMPSLQNQRVDERYEEYLRTLQEYHEAEQNYLNLLFNLERYPGDSYLLQQKKVFMQELLSLRSQMLLSRSEVDQAIQQWELDLREERSKSLGKPPEAEYLFQPQDVGKDVPRIRH